MKRAKPISTVNVLTKKGAAWLDDQRSKWNYYGGLTRGRVRRARNAQDTVAFRPWPVGSWNK